MESVKIDVRGPDAAAMAVIKPAIGEELGPVSFEVDYSSEFIVGVSLSLQGANHGKIRRRVKVGLDGAVDIGKLRKKLAELKAMVPQVEAEKSAREAERRRIQNTRQATLDRLKEFDAPMTFLSGVNDDGSINVRLTPDQYIAIMKIVQEE